MTGNIAKTPLQRLVLVITLLLSIALQYPQPRLDFDYYTELATNYTLSGNGVASEATARGGAPLEGITVVVTGPTSGIGLGLSKKLYELGATIIAVGRSPAKLEKLKEELVGRETNSDQNESNQRVITVVADFADLESVASAADEIKTKFKKIDFLINNAGMYKQNARTESSTVQGFDLVFGVNYLSPFLLTEKLIPLLEKSSMPNNARIIQISSSMHFTVDGSSLVPFFSDSSTVKSSPKASRPSPSIVHNQQSYGASKLAQIYHSRSLQRELQSKETPSANVVQVISLCPSWVATHIAGASMKNVLQLFAFDSNGFGIAPIIYAMFTKNSLVGSEQSDYIISCSFLQNCKVLEWAFSWMSYFDRSGFIRQNFSASMGCFVALPLQKLFAMVSFGKSSTESFNVAYQNELYEWSKDAISPWM